MYTLIMIVLAISSLTGAWCLLRDSMKSESA